MSATRSNPQVVTVSDPTVARQLARTVAQEQATGSTNPVVVTNTETLFNQATASAANAAPGQTSTLTVTSSPANDVGDVVTVYRTTGGITVTAVNETVNQYTSVDSGVSQILAGTGVIITSTGASGTGVVTVSSNTAFGNIVSVNLNGNVNSVLRGDGTWGADANSSYGNSNVVSLLASFGSNTITTTGNVSVGNISATNLGNIAATNYDGNAANVLHGDGTWSADITDYGNSNVANYLPTYTGNISSGNAALGNLITANYANIAFDVNANVVNANFLYGDGSNITNLPVGNIATINLDGNASNALLGDGTFGPVEVTGSSIANGSSNITIPVANGNITLNADSGQWVFDTAGRIEFPGGTAELTSAANYFGLWADGSGNTNGIEFTVGNNAFLSTDGSFQLDTNVANGVYSFVFTDTGLFTLPSGNTQIGFQYGSDAILTSNASFGVATQGANVTTFINWSDDVANTSVMSAIYVNAPNANPGDIHFRVGNVGSPNFWQFNVDGNLVLPNGNSVIYSIANSSLDPTLPNVSTMTLTPDANYNSQVLVLDPTAPGHIHLRAYCFSNIDDPAANIFLGGEDTAFEVTSGANNEVRIHSGGNTWTFDNTGNLTFPRDAAGNTDPILTIASGATPTIQSTDASLAGPANLAISADYLNYSGFNGNRIVLHADTGEVATDANMVLTTNLANTGNTYSWTFGDDGRLTFPGTPRIDTDANNFEVQAAEAISLEANTVVNIYTDAGNNAYQWQFGDDGNLTLPDTTSVIANASITLEANSTGNITGLSVNGDADANLYAHSNVNIVSDGGNREWTFDTTGTLTAPGDITVAGDITGTAGANTLILKAQPNTNTSIQLNSIVDSTIRIDANLEIITDSSNTSQSWNFDIAGNLTLPGNTLAINFANGSSAFGNIVATNLDGNVSNVLTGNGTFVALPVINANTVVWSTAPVANTSNGTAGQAAYDSGGNLYVCVATDTWSKFIGTTSW